VALNRKVKAKPLGQPEGAEWIPQGENFSSNREKAKALVNCRLEKGQPRKELKTQTESQRNNKKTAHALTR